MSGARTRTQLRRESGPSCWPSALSGQPRAPSEEPARRGESPRPPLPPTDGDARAAEAREPVIQDAQSAGPGSQSVGTVITNMDSALFRYP